jgi:hypothetical protein
LFFASEGSPLSGPEDAIRLLASPAAPGKHKDAAYQTAHSWFDAQDLPAAVRATLESDPTYAGARLLKVFFEKPSEANASGAGHTNVLAVVEVRSGLAIVGVVGKLNEPFGDYVSEWNDGSPGRATRLAASIKQLGMPADVATGLRYQLIHRTVSILLEAQTIGARKAVLLIQSFGSDHSPTGFADLQMFGAVLGAPITDTGILSPAVELDGIELRLGWSVCSPRRED